MITLFDSKDSIIERFAQVEKVARKWIVLPENIEEFPQTTRPISYRNLIRDMTRIDSPALFAMWFAQNPIEGAVEYWLKSFENLDERASNQILLSEILGKRIELSNQPNAEKYKPNSKLTDIFDHLSKIAPIEISEFKKTRSTWLYSAKFAPTTFGDLFDRINPTETCPMISWSGFTKIAAPDAVKNAQANDLDTAIQIRVDKNDCIVQLNNDKISWYITSWGKSTNNSELAALLNISDTIDESELYFGGECLAKNVVINRPLFLFFLLNTWPFNKICAVDESILERKKNSIYLYFFPNKKFVTAHLNQVGPHLQIKIHKVASQNLQTYFVRFLSVLFASYLHNEAAIARYYNDMNVTIRPVDIKEEVAARKVTLFDQEPEIFGRYYAKKCQKPPTIVDDSWPNGLKFPTRQQAIENNLQQRTFACLDPEFPYIGIRTNDLDNKDKFPCLPCCYDSNQMTKKSKLRTWLTDGTCGSDESRVRGVLLTQKILMPGGKGELPPLLAKIFGVIYGQGQTFLRTFLMDYDSQNANVWIWDEKGLVTPSQLPVYYDLEAPYMHIFKNYGTASNKQLYPSFEVIVDKSGKFIHTELAEEFIKLANLSWAYEIDGQPQETVVFEPRMRQDSGGRNSAEFAAWWRAKKMSKNIIWNAIWVAAHVGGDLSKLKFKIDPNAQFVFQQLLPNKSFICGDGTLVIPEPLDILSAIKGRDFEQVPEFIPDYYETLSDFNSTNIFTTIPIPTPLSTSSTPGDDEFWFNGWYAIRQNVDALPENCLVTTIDLQTWQLGDGGTTKWLLFKADQDKKIFYKLFYYKKE